MTSSFPPRDPGRTRRLLHEERMFQTSSRAIKARCQPFRDIQRFCLRSLARSCTKCDTAVVVKVAFIGAGSVEFTRNVVTDLSGYPELAGELDLALHDVSAERLAHAQTLAARIAAQSG